MLNAACSPQHSYYFERRIANANAMQALFFVSYGTRRLELPAKPPSYAREAVSFLQSRSEFLTTLGDNILCLESGVRCLHSLLRLSQSISSSDNAPQNRGLELSETSRNSSILFEAGRTNPYYYQSRVEISMISNRSSLVFPPVLGAIWHRRWSLAYWALGIRPVVGLDGPCADWV